MSPQYIFLIVMNDEGKKIFFSGSMRKKADSTIFQIFFQKILKEVHLVDEEIASKICLLYAKILKPQAKITMK